MARLTRAFLLAGLFLLAFLNVFPREILAQDKDQDVDAKLKRLEELEARVDAKLKRLETLETRLEARLETGVQPIAARSGSESVAGSSVNGAQGVHATAIAASAAAGASTRPAAGSDLEARVNRLEEESIHQVIFRGGFMNLNRAAKSSGGILGGFTGPKNDTKGWTVGSVIGVKLMRDPFFDNPLFGEVSLDYSRIQGKTVPLSGLQKNGNQSFFRVSVAPKYTIANLGDFSPALRNIHPWITPIGLSFLVNSPPSDSAAYLTVGGTTGAGLEYLLYRKLSLGLGVNYNFYDRSSNRLPSNHLSVTPYVGVNF